MAGVPRCVICSRAMGAGAYSPLVCGDCERPTALYQPTRDRDRKRRSCAKDRQLLASGERTREAT